MPDAALVPLLLQFAAAYGCMLVIPGTNTLLVLRSCDGLSARKPLLAAGGVATGAALASVLAASSAAALPHGSAFRAISGITVAILLFHAALRSSRTRLRTTASTRASAISADAAPFLVGFGAALINPVSVPYFASFFVSHACTGREAALACALVFAMAGLWFSSLGLISTRVGRLPIPAPCRRALDWAVAATLAVFALRAFWAAVIG